jgi:hypothetical protein
MRTAKETYISVLNVLVRSYGKHHKAIANIKDGYVEAFYRATNNATSTKRTEIQHQ